MITNNTTTNKKNRNGFRWTINECLRLQREFELLKLSLEEIACLHGRTVKAIMFKLDSEGFANYKTLCKQYENEMTPKEGLQ